MRQCWCLSLRPLLQALLPLKLETANQEVCEDLNNMLYMDDAVALMSIPPYTHSTQA